MKTLDPDTEVYELHSKFIEIPHLAYADQTGKFPVQSRPGKKYLLVLFKCDVSAIIVEPIPNSKTKILQEATLKLLDQVKQKGHKPASPHIDNETSEEHPITLEDQVLTV